MEGNKVKQEGVHTKGIKHNFYSGEEKQLLQQESTSVTGDGRFCRGEDMSSILGKQTAEKRGLIGGGQSCEGEDSPVSVICAASKHLMQQSHPSSACTSMEHPLHHLNIISPATPAHLFHFNSRILPSDHEPYAGSMSERVQQAFSKSHELTLAKAEFNVDLENIMSASHELYNAKVKPWPNYTKGRMEWLNLLQEEPPLMTVPAAIHSKVYVQSHTFASSPDDEAEGFSICSSTRDPDEESVIDFFPSANRPSSAMQLRRRSYDKVNEVEKGNNGNEKEFGVCLKMMSSRGMQRMSGSGGGGGDDDADRDQLEGPEGSRMSRVSCSSSSNWDEAERWLTNCSSSSRSAPPPPPTALSNAWHFNTLPKADIKHISENSHDPKGRLSEGSHGSTGAMRETGTEMGLESMRDMATQSTPTDWSRCASPETANFSTAAETKVPNSAPEKGACALKTSPPRHNTPARRSVSCHKQSATKQGAPAHFSNGKLSLLELENCHLDKLKLARDLPLGTSSTWQLYLDEDVDHSVKLLEHKTPVYESSKNHQHVKVDMLEARVSAWEDVARAKHIAKFKREEAKIEAWERLQRAEADAELRKLEVKLEKLRFEGREKIMGRFGAAQRRAQEMHDAAESHKIEQLTRVGMRANHIRKSGHVPSSTFNVVCSLTTKIKPTSNLSFS